MSRVPQDLTIVRATSVTLPDQESKKKLRGKTLNMKDLNQLLSSLTEGNHKHKQKNINKKPPPLWLFRYRCNKTEMTAEPDLFLSADEKCKVMYVKTTLEMLLLKNVPQTRFLSD